MARSRLDQVDRVLVPVANPETTEALMETAVDLARAADAEVIALAVATVPSQLPLSAVDDLPESDREQLVGNAREVAALAQEMGTDAGVPVRGQVRVGRDVAKAILSGAADHEADVILMGWRGRPRRRDVILGSFVDQIIEKAEQDVLVKRIEPRIGDADSILVAAAGGPHGAFSGAVAGAIAREHDARIHVVHVTDPDAEESVEPERALDQTLSGIEGIETTTEIIEADDVVRAIVSESADHDLTVLGATRDRRVRSVLLGSIPEDVGRSANSAVIMARSAEKRGSRIRGAAGRLADRVRGREKERDEQDLDGDEHDET